MTFINYFYYFLIYAFLGYIIEVIYVFILTRKIHNRGFLYSPICPIYGFGALFIIPLYYLKDYWYLVFILGIIITSTLEYITSYLMEKLFKRRWWDYSDYFCNLNGRICFRNSLLFAFLVLFVIYILHPAVIFIVSKIASPYYYIIFALSLVGIITDITLSTIKSAKFSIILKKAELKFNDIKNGLNDKLSDFKSYINDSKLIKKLKSAKNRFPSMRIKLRKNDELKSPSEVIDEIDKKE